MSFSFYFTLNQLCVPQYKLNICSITLEKGQKRKEMEVRNNKSKRESIELEK